MQIYQEPITSSGLWFYFSVQWFTLFTLRGIKLCGEWKCSNYVVVKCFLRSQFSNLNVLCVNDHILNSFLFFNRKFKWEKVTLQLKSWPPLPMLDCKGFETRIGRKPKNKIMKSLRMADNFLSFNHNNIKCKRKTTQQKAVRNGLKCDEWRHRLVSRHAHLRHDVTYVFTHRYALNTEK